MCRESPGMVRLITRHGRDSFPGVYELHSQPWVPTRYPEAGNGKQRRLEISGTARQ
jgi:hypothetical protein